MVHEEPTEKNLPDPNRELWQRFKIFSNFLDQQLNTKGAVAVLNTVICALIVQRLPYSMKQLVIRSRREKEAQSGNDLRLDDLLDLFNSLIHDVEIATASKEKSKKKVDQPDDDGKKAKKPDGKRPSASRSLLTKKKKVKCVLCSSDSDNVISHHLDHHRMYSLEEIQSALANNNRCLKCAAIIEKDSGCSKGLCKNVTRPCWHCGSAEHHNLLCPTPKVSSPTGGPIIEGI